MMESSGTRRRKPRSPEDRIAERDDAAGIAAFACCAVHALGGTFEELAALVGGDDGVDIEVEGIVDVLVGGAEGDADGLKHPPDAEKLECVAAQAVGADHPDLGEAANTRITRKRAASRPVFERDGARDAVILVMLEDDNTRLRRQTAGQGGALVADGMAVTLLVGGDAGVGGDVANGIGQDDLQRDGERSGMYEGSGGAERSRRIGILQEEPTA